MARKTTRKAKGQPRKAAAANQTSTGRANQYPRKVEATDTCFVMQPFDAPLGDYYEKIYRPAIERAGLRPIRADAEIFGTGKIIHQV